MIEGARNPHLSWRELVCLGQEKLLEPEGISGEQWGEPGGAGCTGRGWRISQPRWSAPPKSREDPKGQVATLTRGPLPPCFWHSAPSHSLHCPTYSSLFTTPLPLGSKRRKALRMASSGSVPGRPREPGEHPHRQLPSPTEEEPRVWEGTFQITESREGVLDTKCSFGLRDAGIGCLSEMPGLARRLGLGIWE